MIGPLLRIWTIAINTVREAIRNKLLYTLLLFAVALIGTGALVASLSYVETDRILQDVGLAAIRLFGTGIAIFVGVGLIHGEVERRTIYTILSKPVSRSEFLVGKYVGLVLTVWLQLAVMSLAFILVSLTAGAPFTVGHLQALLLVGVELMLVVGVATLFSAFTTPMLASLFSLGVYLLGHLTRNLKGIGAQSGDAGVEAATRLLYRVLPDLEAFNLTVQASHQLPIEASQVYLPVLYGLGYSAAILFAATFIFRRRDLR